MEEAVLLCRRLLLISKLGISTWWRANSIRLAITAYCSMRWSHLEHRYVHMQDNDPKHSGKLCQRYIKSKEGQHFLQLTSWSVQSVDLNSTELEWDELDWKVRDKQSTRAALLWQFLQEIREELSSVYFQSLVENMLNISEWSSDVCQRGSFWWMKGLRKFFCVFLV